MILIENNNFKNNYFKLKYKNLNSNRYLNNKKIKKWLK